MKLQYQAIKPLIYTLATLGLCHTALAGNIAVNGVSARAESIQAFTAVADDPSAIYYNPAGLPQVKGTKFELGLGLIAPYQTYIRDSNQVKTRSNKKSLGGGLFFSTDRFDHVTLGLGLYAPFARATSYQQNQAVNYLSESASIMRIDLVPTAAFQLNPWMSIGLGLVISRAQNRVNMLSIQENAHGYAATGQGGILLKLPQKIRIGVSYRAPEKLKLRGSGGLPGMESNYTAQFRFPGTLSAGISWQATKKFLISIEVDDEMWSYLQEVSRKFKNQNSHPAPTTTIDAHDSLDARAGIAFKIDKDNTVRTGYSYIEAALPQKSIAPAQPDYNMHMISVGYSLHFKSLYFDATYEYGFAQKRQGTSPIPTYQGQYDASVNIIMLDIGYKFG